MMRPYSRVMRLPRWNDLASPRRLDLLIAAGLLAWGLPDVPWWWEYPGHAGSTPDVLGSLALTLAMSVPFCWRRRFPVPVLALALAVLAIRGALHRNEVSAFGAVLVASYGLGAYAPAIRRYARWLGWFTLAAAVVAVPLSTRDRLAAVPFALLAAALVLGDSASARRVEAAAAVETAHQAERTRIARELHDVVAHQLSAIAVQAGAARIAACPASPASPPSRDSQVLATVERLAREALTELNHLLGALRREPTDDPARPPAPTLADLDTLIARSRAAGIPANLTVEGTPHSLSPGIEVSCYRIIAEALANVARHAPAAPTRVVVRYQAGSLGIEVANGPAGRRPTVVPRPASGGRGVRGMRERAELYGGDLTAQASPDGGFVVAARIPCQAATASPGAISPGMDSTAASGPGAAVTLASPVQERT
jgi:signal transduction histidine kinase